MMVRTRMPPLGSDRKNRGRSKTFKQLYMEAEGRRLIVKQRLETLSESARAHPAYKHALTLLNQTFRKV